MDRKVAPQIKEIKEISFSTPKKHTIAGQTNLFHMKKVPNKTARLDLYFDAGKIHGDTITASLVNGLLLSGTKTKSAVQIQEEINALGGFLESGISVENSVISIYCLRKKLPKLFSILIDAIQNVEFNPKEIDELVADRKQKLKISEEKVNFLAQRGFREELFASNKKYATGTFLSDYENIDRQKLIDFHKEFYLNGLTKMVIVANIKKKEIKKFIEVIKPMAKEIPTEFASSISNRSGRKNIQKTEAIQSAIRVGRTLFNKKHNDYLDFLVLNTILGDYFGSRLMKNIREDKGYTYGIGSILAELNETGYFLIATEVGSDVCEKALQEIKKELTLLQTELVSEEELSIVKNYMLGQLLKSADGPYAMTDLFLSAELQGKGLDFYNQAISAIQSITPQRIQELAKQYLNWEEMSIVVAGKS